MPIISLTTLAACSYNSTKLSALYEEGNIDIGYLPFTVRYHYELKHSVIVKQTKTIHP